MDNPIKIWRELKDIYLKYIDSGLPLSHDKLIQERRNLYEQGTAICQPPIIELVPSYEEIATLPDVCNDKDLCSDFADFAQCGLFPDNGSIKRKLYKHQKEALEFAIKKDIEQRKHIIATTGTGSGKTECFLLPVIADLVSESKKWDNNRTKAVRTLILYPLNALAEDQMIRLRKSLNSESARNWLDKNRDGHRFTFGRYTGKTPTSGKKEKRKDENAKVKKQYIADWEAAKKANDQNPNNDLLYHVTNMDDGSAELWDRWSMQKTPPDILITNYSMLNIMLFRRLENSIFEQTKKWLEEDENNVFHLVVDELHTYRGTAGTEVAYLLRLVLNKLGLHPNHKQLQFLASSASMQKNEKTEVYLSSFFGVDRNQFENKFKLLSNPPHKAITQEPSFKIPVDTLNQFADIANNEGITQAENYIFAETQCNSFNDIVEKYHLLDCLKYAMQDDETPNILTAKKAPDLAQKLFHNTQSEKALEGLLLLFCQCKTKSGAALQPIRAHYFFRNIDGLWTCSNPNCSEVEEKYKWDDRTVGKLYRSPGINTCSCGSKIYEALICRNCGEIYFTGFDNKSDNIRFLDRYPNSENSKQVVLWNKKISREVIEDESNHWARTDFNPLDGEIDITISGKKSLFVPDNAYIIDLPNLCPNCQLSYKIKDEHSLSPIAKHNTGVQKINQVMADALMRTMRQGKSIEELDKDPPSLVLFSDSRQAAAKLSAGIELDHYRDVLRQIVLNSLESEDVNIQLLRKIRAKQQITNSEIGIIRKWINEGGNYAKYNSIINNEAFYPSDSKEIIELNDFLKKSTPSLQNIEYKVLLDTASLGINPSGPKPSLNLWGDTHWKELFDWSKKEVTRNFTGSQSTFFDRIVFQCNVEQLVTIFAHKNRSFESLKLGYVSANYKNEDIKFAQFVDVAIRLLGENWRIDGYESKYARTSLPQSVWSFAKAVYGDKRGKYNKPHIDKLIEILKEKHITKTDELILTGKGLFFKKSNPGDTVWICSKCKTVHLHESCGVCSNCCSKSLIKHTISEEELNDKADYYIYLAKSAEPYRLHCEELTGQTSKEDSTKRQRLFQGILLEDEGENKRVDKIDLLSVTTTMEAGVDIGSLSAVMMGNVPPQRFNYQQRVGRAGRRGHALSVALTIAKANSHDQTHYFQTERMVSATPKDPYLEITSSEIAARMVIRQVLQCAFQDTVLENLSDNVHGEFGTATKWQTENREVVKNWISENKKEIAHIIDCIIVETRLNKSKDDIEKYISEKLIEDIDSKIDNPDYPQKALSEKLSNAGLLPMFGFPTRVRLLYHKKPKKIPANDVVDRNLDIAISSFAPGSEIVKDKELLKAVGFVNYEKNFGEIKERNGLNELQKKAQICKVCGFTTLSEDIEVCPYCDSTEIESIKVCSPLGFCTDYDADVKDFNGRFDFQPFSTSMSLDAASVLNPIDQKVGNLSISSNILPQNGIVHQVNTNEGKLFHVGRLKDTNRYVAPTAYPKNRPPQIFDEKDIALIASKTTGVLTVGIKNTNESIDLNSLPSNEDNHKEIEAAFISWGYLLQRAICSFLDIETNEIEVGFQINREKKSEIFFVERLENGAGYCNYLSGRIYEDVPYNALIKSFAENDKLYQKYISKEHQLQCASSCYDCIRDFYNQKYHSIMNWRLGLDLAELSKDKDAQIDFSHNYWQSYLKTIVDRFRTSKEIEKDIYVVGYRKKKILISHPFWSKKYIDELKQKYDFDKVKNIIKAEILTKEM